MIAELSKLPRIVPVASSDCPARPTREELYRRKRVRMYKCMPFIHFDSLARSICPEVGSIYSS